MVLNQLGVIKKRTLSTDPDVVRRRMAREQRRQDALRLRMAGASYMDIVKAGIGYKSTGHVSNDLNRALDDFQNTYETPASVVVLDLARLDDIQRRLTLAFHTGDLSQAGMLLRVMQFRREVLGINAETAINDRNNQNALVNNGVMVIQGSAEDYLKTMMQAAGASPERQRLELERLARSNQAAQGKPDDGIEDAEIVPDEPEKPRKKKLKKLRRKSLEHVETPSEVNGPLDSSELEKVILEREQNDSEVEKLPIVPLTGPLLSIDFPDGTRPGKKRLRVRVKDDTTNMDSSSAVPYRQAPRMPSQELSQRRLLARGARATSSGPNRDDLFGGSDVSALLYDEIEAETITQNID